MVACTSAILQVLVQISIQIYQSILICAQCVQCCLNPCGSTVLVIKPSSQFQYFIVPEKQDYTCTCSSWLGDCLRIIHPSSVTNGSTLDTCCHVEDRASSQYQEHLNKSISHVAMCAAATWSKRNFPITETAATRFEPM